MVDIELTEQENTGNIETEVENSVITGVSQEYVDTQDASTLASAKTYTDNHHDSTKQDTISDLSDIRSGANKGATSIQPNDNVSELTNDAGYLTQHQSLANYYTKSETYKKTEVDSAISNHHDATKEDADATILKQANVVNNVTSTTTNMPLSANMGKELQDQVNNLKNIGRFLAIWNSSTGLPLTNPTEMPYQYRTGDYYRVGAVGDTNYKPNGSTYTGTASTTIETEDVEVGWVYYFDGTQWLAQSGGGGGTVQDVQVNGTTVVASGSGIANIQLNSFGINATTTELNYVSGATSNIQTQIGNKQNAIPIRRI